ncbi:bifunctional N(6)-L-threonylcarbamoyladenine synthase/serine/threonine protein kinase [Candidatus Woesearchaeota archaeon]|jgi:N6-L-threonylcarbamoyladenine synthase|nr:bifunctional N(6)-L-threonylcarbamoyladenine synthase/serine/threonine protein kinase [Candidatus Woesearchaeota archaeon]
MICLGIETTAHTFGIGIVTDKKKILANVKDSYTTKKGGMIPIKAAEHHVEVCDAVLKGALEKANIKLEDIDLISFSQGPGMGNCLRIGAFFARSLALRLNKPIIGINHCIAHLSIGKMLNNAKDPVLLYASGANTQIIAYEGGKYRIFGETLDIGIGNFLDNFARYLGLGFPGGPKLDVLAKKGKKLIELPYAVKGMDVSFSGLLTNLKHKHDDGHKDADLAYSCQETAFAMLIEVAERALAHCDKKELLLGGGVACNSRLQEMAKIMCKERGAKCFTVPNEFNVDNGLMIAWQGILQYKAGTRMEIKDTKIMPYQRTDDIRVNWI